MSGRVPSEKFKVSVAINNELAVGTADRTKSEEKLIIFIVVK